MELGPVLSLLPFLSSVKKYVRPVKCKKFYLFLTVFFSHLSWMKFWKEVVRLKRALLLLPFLSNVKKTNCEPYLVLMLKDEVFGREQVKLFLSNVKKVI